MIKNTLLFCLLLCNIALFTIVLNASNPIKKGFGMADPHAYIFNNKVYLFTTRDSEPKAKSFVMPDWHIWSSSNLLDWKHERTIYPEENYIGKSNNCWATETVYKNNKYYFYFSNGNKDTGVMVANKPEGPYLDILHKPLLPSGLTSGAEYDPTVFVDMDGKAYIIFGHYVNKDPNLHYFIARLNDDMISLAESPRVLELTGDKKILLNNDKPNLHKHKGVYYLSAGTHYATSTTVYGPYVRVGNTGKGKYGLDGRAHGNFFMWHNQWFHIWCHFFLGKEVAYFRESYITYAHYRGNGELVSDTELLDNHFYNGVGQYDANWDKIESEWFMSASRQELKTETKKGDFVISNMCDGDFVSYPNIKHLNGKKKIVFQLRIINDGDIEIREGSLQGQVIGTCHIHSDKLADSYKEISCEINPKSGMANLFLIFKSVHQDFCHFDFFRFD